MRRFSLEARPRNFADRFPGYQKIHRISSRLAGCLAVCLGISGCAISAAPPPQKTVAVPKKNVVIPRPSAKLLAREPAPKCTYTDEEPAKIASAAPSSEGNGANTTESSPSTAQLTESLNRRERERDCFRDAEHRVRTKLTKLQTSVRATMKAVDELNTSGEH